MPSTGFQCTKDWQLADNTISSIDNDKDDVVNWWHSLSLKNDPEGDLVLGWLARHKHIQDPDGLSIKERMDRARKGGWDIPLWMNEIKS